MKQPSERDIDVLTVGSIHLDHRYLVRVLPRAGETVIAESASHGLGGKGANQAVAAARSGVRSALVGFVGSDGTSSDVLDRLTGLGVDTTGVIRVDNVDTGAAAVIRDAEGENQIVVSSGANAVGDMTEPTLREAIERSTVLLLQGEVAVETSERAAKLAEETGTRVVINLAPVVDFGEALTHADPLVVNEVEAAQLLGIEPDDTVDGMELATGLSGYARSVVVTLGEQGAVFVAGPTSERVPAPGVDVVDTTGAGDAFVGALAAQLALGTELSDAVRFAVVAASKSVEMVGAAESYPVFLEEAN